MARFYPNWSADCRPLVFAHRGGSALAPENTVVAFDRGLALGADGLELDVHLSRDGVVVVHHDRTLDRTTSARGAIGALTADELARVDAGHHFRHDGSFPFRGRDIGIPTLAAVLARYRDVPIIVELKMNTRALAAATIETVRRADAVERVCIASFGLRAIRAARELAPEITTSAAREEIRWSLYRSWCGWPARRPPYACYLVPEWSGVTRIVSPRFVEIAHRASLGVQVWTINREEDAARLLAWGADALITDRPDLMVPLCTRPR